VGIKSAWLDNRLIFNLSAFYIDWKDQQVLLQSGPTEVTVKNAAESTSKGFELEVKARPITGLQFSAGFGYTEAKFDDFTAIDKQTGVLTDYEENCLQFVPKYTYNLGVQYRHESGFFGRADLFGKDKFYGDYANTAKADSYETVNLRIGYEGENFDFILWAKNVFDEEYLTYVAPMNGYDVGVDGSPQTFGATVTYRF